MTEVWPNTWNSGSPVPVRSALEARRRSAPISPADNGFPTVSWAPFGRPVVADVYRMAAVSSRSRSTTPAGAAVTCALGDSTREAPRAPRPPPRRRGRGRAMRSPVSIRHRRERTRPQPGGHRVDRNHHTGRGLNPEVGHHELGHRRREQHPVPRGRARGCQGARIPHARVPQPETGPLIRGTAQCDVVGSGVRVTAHWAHPHRWVDVAPLRQQVLGRCGRMTDPAAPGCWIVRWSSRSVRRVGGGCRRRWCAVRPRFRSVPLRRGSAADRRS